MKSSYSKIITFFSIFLCLTLVGHSTLSAQSISSEEYTDHKPVYRKWQDSYILDKIEYTKNSTVFYFRFVCRSGQGISAIFYPPGGEFPWYLKAKEVGKSYGLKAIKNIRRNGELLAANLHAKKEYLSLDGFGYTVFSCEVHFERMPNNVKVVDLIEGKGQEFNQNHFNCFEVKLKTWNDTELGKINDSEENVRKFENKFGVNTISKPKIEPKVEPKVEPKIEPKVEPKVDPIAKVEPKVEPKKATPKPDPENPYPLPRLRDKNDIVCGQKLVLDAMQFQDGTTDFKGMVDCQRAMIVIYNYMRENPTATVTFIGHTDIFGPVERNMELSQARAQKVARWLSMIGISPFRIETEHYGPKQPLKPEGSPINRRVEMVMKCN